MRVPARTERDEIINFLDEFSVGIMEGMILELLEVVGDTGVEFGIGILVWLSFSPVDRVLLSSSAPFVIPEQVPFGQVVILILSDDEYVSGKTLSSLLGNGQFIV